jgi:hypothetical protein
LFTDSKNKHMHISAGDWRKQQFAISAERDTSADAPNRPNRDTRTIGHKWFFDRDAAPHRAHGNANRMDSNGIANTRCCDEYAHTGNRNCGANTRYRDGRTHGERIPSTVRNGDALAARSHTAQYR